MKAVILAGGYAKRMWPYTLSRPKALLEIGGRPLVQYLLQEKLAGLGLEAVYVSVNKRFEQDFRQWLDRAGSAAARGATLVVENSFAEEQKLGSVGALRFLIEKEQIRDDLLVVAGDNIFDFDLSPFLSSARGTVLVGLYDIGGKQDARRFGVVELDGSGKITSFEEKPERPKTSLISTGMYVFPRQSLPLIPRYLADGNNPDAPGHFLSWLHTRQPVFGHVFRGTWLDIGSMEAYERARKAFG